MDEDGLPTSGVDLNKVPPIPQKHTVTFLNHYLSRSSELLNGMSSTAERKLENVLAHLQRIEAGVCILEAKLESIPGMTNGITPEPESQVVREPPPVVTTQPTKADKVEQAEVSPTISPAPTEEPVTEETVEEVPHTSYSPICEDSRFKIYFDMLAKGVLLPAVKQKMMCEGVDPELIHKPKAPAPPPDCDD